MQDPYFAVKEEVEHSVNVVVELHKKWSTLEKNGEELSKKRKNQDQKNRAKAN